MKHQEVKSWVENEGIVSTVQCNRVIGHGQDDPPPPMPPPMPMQRSFSDLDLRPPPARPPQPETKKVYVELSPHLDVEFGKPPKKTPKVELVPNHIFQYYVRTLHHEAVLRGKRQPNPRAQSPPPRKAHVEVKKFVEPPPPPLPEPQIIVQQPRPPQSEVRWAPDPVPQRRPKPILKEKRVIDPRVPKHWWQYNHPGKLVDDDDHYVATNQLPGNPGFNPYVQNVIEKRYVVDQVEQEDQVSANPIYAQVQRRGVTRNSSKRASAMSNDYSPSWVSDYGSVDYSYVGAPQGRPASFNGNYPGNRDSEIIVSGQNTHLIN